MSQVGRRRPRERKVGSARLGSARLGSARLGSARLGSARLLIILFAASSLSSAFKIIALPLHVRRRDCRRAGSEPRKRCRVGSSKAAVPSGQDEGAKNARAEDPRSGSGHLRPNGRWFERYGVKPNADRMGTLPVAQRSGHVLDRLARSESVEGATRRARAQHSAKVGISHFRCIRPITSVSFKNTSTSSFSANIKENYVGTCPTYAAYGSIGLTETDRSLPRVEDRSDRGRENAARCRTAAGEGSSRPIPRREAGPRPSPGVPGRAGGRIRIGDGVRARATDRCFEFAAGRSPAWAGQPGIERRGSGRKGGRRDDPAPSVQQYDLIDPRLPPDTK